MKYHSMNRMPIQPMSPDLALIKRRRRIIDACTIGAQAVVMSFFICAVCAVLIAYHG